jgi:hypothetical protein
MVRYGKSVTLPALRTLIAKCERKDKIGTACGAYYVELKPKVSRADSGQVYEAHQRAAPGGQRFAIAVCETKRRT